MTAAESETGRTFSPHVQQIHTYLEAATRQDLATAADVFAPTLIYRVPGQNVLSGETTGQQAALTSFGQIMELTQGTYRVRQVQDYLEDADHVLMLAAEQASIDGQEHRWDRLILFTFQDDKIEQVELFEDDQLVLDTFLGRTDRAVGAAAQGEAWTPGPPEMSGQVDDPRVQAIMAYQLNVARGDLDAARTIFDPNVEYYVSGQNVLAGEYRGPDQVMGYFARLGALTDGTYGISRMRWLTSSQRVALVTRNHAARQGRQLSWDEVIVFLFQDGKKRRIDLFSGDQYGVDVLFGNT
ncbi:hypothetical protein E7T06_18965 [Deinococcus sp. Arct2-2]|uniref:nuclear transport factor 2 family protein n=1 Tax=Deinococcus sp. Arct2-2 TaxID=2568653 RepID=UPI0010A2C621|nr:nuclear transport factor 2 family protein [Deinococcus sp. Arct2-2]THF67874.1 hypothetical protein E7T06_18965 [Deinococcus sp. Arct2-2]